jgi:TP901 family phage tail tape measure protein
MTRQTSQLVIELLDRVIAPARRAGAALGGITGRIREANGQRITFGDRLNAAITRNNRSLQQARGGLVDAIGGYYLLREAIGGPVRAAAELETALADVTRVVDFGGAEGVDQFRQDLFDLSREIPLTVTELAAIAAAAGQAGIAAEDLIAFTDAAARIGVAFDISAEQAGASMANLMTALGYTIEEVTSLSDAMNHLSNNQAASAESILDVVNRVGATATMFGFSAEETAAFASAMIASGVSSEIAATSFLNMGRALTRGAAATGRQRDALETLGLDAEDVAQRMQEDAVATTQDVLDRLNRLPAAQRAAIMSNLFGDEARGLGALVTQADLLQESLDLVGDKANYAGSAAEEFDRQNQTYAANMARFRNNLNELQTAIGNGLLPHLSRIAEAITPVVNRLSELANAYPDVTGAVFGAVAGLIAFRAGIAALRFIGLLGKGGLLSLAAGAFTGISTAAAAAAASVGKVRAAMRLALLFLRGNPMMIALLGLTPTAVGDGTLDGNPQIEAASQPDVDAGAIREMGASGFGDMDPAIEQALMDIQEARRVGIPTEQARAELQAYAAELSDEITRLRAQVEQLAGGPMAESLAAPIRQEIEQRQAELAEVQAEIAAAEELAQRLGAALATINGTDVAITIDDASIERALDRVIQLRRELNAVGRDSPGISQTQHGTTPGSIAARARGGPITRGATYLTGENGPELITASRNSYVHPTGQGGGRAGDINLSVNMTVNGGGSDPERIAQDVMRRFEVAVGESLRGIFADTGVRV